MYFITAMSEPKPSAFGPKINCRCFGYYETFEKADVELRRNSMNIHEFRYMIAVIERMTPGIHSIAEEMGWYRYNEETGFWDVSAKPMELTHIVNFNGIG